ARTRWRRTKGRERARPAVAEAEDQGAGRGDAPPSAAVAGPTRSPGPSAAGEGARGPAPRRAGWRVSELPIAGEARVAGACGAGAGPGEHPPEIRVYGAPRAPVPQRLPVTPRFGGCASGAGVGVGADAGRMPGGFRRLPDWLK